MRIAIIGAGATGLPTARIALEYGNEPVVFEKSTQIGGLWKFRYEETEESCVMKTTVINTSKEMNAYSDFPPPKHFANFMHNTQMLNYLRLYAEHHNLLPHIRFRQTVTSIRRSDDFDASGNWIIEYDDGNENGEHKSETYNAVLLCTGHHAIPNIPAPWPNQDMFKGRILHSHSYRDDREFVDQRIIVVGIGNSGGDLAVELSRCGKQVYLATRRGSWISNRVGDYGAPSDCLSQTRLNTFIDGVLPTWINNWRIERRLQMRFDHGKYGLKPAHRFNAAHVTVNDELPTRIACGSVIVKPNIKAFVGDHGVIFEDESYVENIDAILLATGFRFHFDLIENGKLISTERNETALYKYMYPPMLVAKHPTIAICGLIQQIGSIMPIAEMQARVFFDVLSGRTRLPTIELMMDDVRMKRETMQQRYVSAMRHTLQVDHLPFMDELAAMIGAKPNALQLLMRDPFLGYKVLTGPHLSYAYRLQGPHQWSGARRAIIDVWDRIDAPTKTRSIETAAVANSFDSMKIIVAVLSLLLMVIGWLIV